MHRANQNDSERRKPETGSGERWTDSAADAPSGGSPKTGARHTGGATLRELVLLHLAGRLGRRRARSRRQRRGGSVEARVQEYVRVGRKRIWMHGFMVVPCLLLTI